MLNVAILETGDLIIARNDKTERSFTQRPQIHIIGLFFMLPKLFIMDAWEEYARRRTKKEDVDLNTLSEWMESVDHVLKHNPTTLILSSPDTSPLSMTLLLSMRFPVSMKSSRQSIQQLFPLQEN